MKTQHLTNGALIVHHGLEIIVKNLRIIEGSNRPTRKSPHGFGVQYVAGPMEPVARFECEYVGDDLRHVAAVKGVTFGGNRKVFTW
jgi:hypothetical protein